MSCDDWIEIKPGCRMPCDGERVLVADGTAWDDARYRSVIGLVGFYTTVGARVTPTHWMPIVPPLQPDPFVQWWASVDYKQDPRAAWNAALEHARKERTA